MNILRGESLREARPARFVLGLGVAFVVLALGAGSAWASGGSVAWLLTPVAQPTAFQTGTDAAYVLTITNVGGVASSGTVTVKVRLPKGLTTSGVASGGGWSCTPEEEGASEVTCTSEASVLAFAPGRAITIPVAVAMTASGTLTSEMSVSGGVPGCGEPGEPACPSASADASTTVGAPLSSFSLFGFSAALLGENGSLDSRAGGHPGVQTTGFIVSSATIQGGDNSNREVLPRPLENVKQVVIDLPPGVIGNAKAAPTCELSAVTNLGFEPNACPAATRVGTLTLLQPLNVTRLTIYNVPPEHGYPAEFAVYLPSVQRAALLYATLGPGPEYAPRVISSPQDGFIEVDSISSTFFGDPAAVDGAGLAPQAFLTNSSDCAATALTTSIHVDTWQHPGAFNADGTPNFSDSAWKGASSTSPPVTGCGALRFNPSMSVTPDTSAPDAPAGLNVDLTIPQNEDPNGLGTPPLKALSVALPRGMVLSPSAADGLQACSDEQIDLGSNSPGSCPEASQIGTVVVHSPLLANAVDGQVFLGAPECSPCTDAKGDPQSGRLARFFVQVHSAEYGITIKLPARVSVDPASGQLTATVSNSPQLPFDDLKLSLNGGPRAPLATPSACGSYTTSVDLTPWSSPSTPDATLSPTFAIAGCGDPAVFAPTFAAGTVDPQAGAYSPFTLTFSRRDTDQQFSSVSQTLPPGLSAKLAGVPLCGDAQAAAGECPETSAIGSVTVGAGPGTNPFYTSGKVYLTGPYGGGPFGIAVIVHAIAGPFNLGTVVVRGAIDVDPHTAQATVVTDAFPTSLDGIPLQIRTVNVILDRPGFTFNATSCAPMAITSTLVSTAGGTAGVSAPYEATNCANLPFKPLFTASTQAKTSKADGASLHVHIASAPGQANIGKAKVDLPIQLPSRLTTLQKACLAAVFAANPANCPAASDVGTGTVITPQISSPLVGPAYLVSYGAAKFPDLEVVLQGEGITLELDGQTDIKKGITSSTFKTVPDAPISTFDLTLPEGPHSALTNYGNLCANKSKLNMATLLTGQNGATLKQTTKISISGCPKVKAKAKAKSKRPDFDAARGAGVAPLEVAAQLRT